MINENLFNTYKLQQLIPIEFPRSGIYNIILKYDKKTNSLRTIDMCG